MNKVVLAESEKIEKFNKAYQSLLYLAWTDRRIPKELKALVEECHPQTALELGCGLGNFSFFMAKQGIMATGVDFSGIAIEKARKRAGNKMDNLTFIQSDVTQMDMLTSPFDMAFDIGCFHCLNGEAQEKYAREIFRVLKPDAPLLIWTLDHTPIGTKINSEHIATIFLKSGFQLIKSQLSRRRIIASHWYWLLRNSC